jgi:uncharacterized membrane protein
MEQIVEEIRIEAPREQVYELWRRPSTFLEIVGALEDVTFDGERWRWEAGGPLGMTLEGEARITADEPPQRLAWCSVEGSVDARGDIDLREDGDATIMRYELQFEMPGGAAGSAVVGALTDPHQHVKETLERFRRLAEDTSA